HRRPGGRTGRAGGGIDHRADHRRAAPRLPRELLQLRRALRRRLSLLVQNRPHAADRIRACTPMKRWFLIVPLALAALVSIAPPARAADAALLAPPQYIGPPKPEHAASNRAFQGIPSMAVAPHGRLWADWYAGVTPGEDQNNYVVLSTSADG